MSVRKQKPTQEICRSELYKRSKRDSYIIQNTLTNTTDQGRSQIIKHLRKQNPGLFDNDKYYLSENDVIELITDNSLSDRNILKILQKL